MEQKSVKEIVTTAFRENLRPGLALQSFALLLVLLYYFVPAAQPFYQTLTRWKTQGGYLYSVVATAFFGGILPFLMILLKGKTAGKRILPLLLFYVLFWAVKGLEIDLFYQFQAILFGDSNHWWVVTRKVLFDQGVYVPFWAVPTMTILYLWRDSDFNWSGVKERLQQESFFRRCFRVIVPNYMIWIPAVTIVYNLPLILQLPLFNLVLAFWALIMSSVSEQ